MGIVVMGRYRGPRVCFASTSCESLFTGGSLSKPSSGSSLINAGVLWKPTLGNIFVHTDILQASSGDFLSLLLKPR